jgi:hypothetical protein
MKLTALIAAVALLACGCATTTVEPVSLQALPEFKVSYTGQLGTEPVGDLPEYTQPEGEPSRAYTLTVRILKAESGQAERLLGKQARMVGAWELATDALDAEALKTLQTVSAPRLTVYEGQAGTISVINQIAYISGFEISGQAEARVADPVIDVLNEGLLLGLKAESAGDTHLRLSVDLTLCSLMKPVASQEVKVLGAAMTVQTPVVYTQRIKGEGRASEDRLLVLTGMAEGDTVYIVLIDAERVSLTEDSTPENK